MPGKSYQKQIIQRDYEDHLHRLTTMKSTLNTRQSSSSTSITTNNNKQLMKRQQIYSNIELENQYLLQRLIKIMSKPNTLATNNTTTTLSGGSGTAAHFTQHKSLLSTAKKLELQRITQDNQRLLKRIQEIEPCYNHLIWEEEAKKREIYKRNMSEFANENTNHTLRPIRPHSHNNTSTKMISRENDNTGSGSGNNKQRNKSATIRTGNDSQEQQWQSQHQQQPQHQQGARSGRIVSANGRPPAPSYGGNDNSVTETRGNGIGTRGNGKLRPLSAPRPRMSPTEYL